MALPALSAIAGVLALTVGGGEIVTSPSDTPAPTPAPKPCAAAEFRQFDFWLGDWDVTAGGKTAGRNRITSILGGCALREEWTGGTTGTSLNMWDSSAKRWRQTWVDSQANVLLLTGARKGESMVLEGDGPGEGGAMVRHRITWSPLPGGRVRQLWDASKDGGRTWKVLFDGEYVKRSG